MENLYLIPVRCKTEAGYISDLHVDSDSPIIPGKKYHVFHAEHFNGKLYYSLIEFGIHTGFEVDLFEEDNTTIPEYKQWQKIQILN